MSKEWRLSTKEDYRELLNKICNPLKPYFSEGKAHIYFGATGTIYNEKTRGLEAFSRPLWGLAPLWAGGGENTLDTFYTEGMKNGSNPEHEEFWGTYKDCDQAYVEMAAMGLGLILAPDRLWDPLTKEEKKNLAKWLRQINENDLVHNNWQFFRVLVNLGLKNVGEGYNSEKVEESLAIIEDCYLGDGWYSDGKTKQRDYYIPFAMHFYGLIYAKIMREEDRERSKRYIERAKLFAEDYIHWFSETGEALPYGRSQTYRFAQCCFFSGLLFNDVEVLPWGVIKGIINRHLRWWMSQPIFDEVGLLTIGYAYPNIHMAEGYNGHGSPYWALKSFLFLALQDTHPFWKAEELPFPKVDQVREIEHAGMIMMRPEEGHVIALTSGQYAPFEPNHVAEKYAKFAYSSYFGFNLPRSYYLVRQAVPDNMLAFERDGLYFVRRNCETAYIENGSIYSKWSPMQKVMVETIITPHEKGHIRKHIIHSEYDLKAIECGFSVPNEDYPIKEHQCGDKYATIDTEEGYSHIQILKGGGKGNYTLCEANTNLVHNRTIMPYIDLEIKKGKTEVELLVVGLRRK